MHATNSLRFFVLGLSVAGMLCGLGVRAETYRWTDEHGKVHYSDQLPPEQAKRPREKLNTQTRKRELQEGEKSPEQLARERQLKELRAQQERLLREQRDSDLSLLRTYRSEDDLVSALQGKLQMIDSQVKLVESNLRRQEEILARDQQRAADLERKGQPIQKNLLDSIESTRREKTKLQDQIRKLEGDKQAITQRFTKDIERFKALQLRQKDLSQGHGGRGQLLAEDQSGREGIIISAVACSVGAVCDKAWTLSKSYVKEHATTPLITETEKILQTANPAEDGDIALTVSRIAGKNEDILFLDVRCRSSSLGEELCRGEKVRNIRAGFKSFIEAGLTRPSAEHSGAAPP
jgi:hypothetical protein